MTFLEDLIQTIILHGNCPTPQPRTSYSKAGKHRNDLIFHYWQQRSCQGSALPLVSGELLTAG